ncbi:50S ribosomal protein L25 [Brevibacillus fulvus]|uniref:Large ribosomal subunit protein bL25 n=1 Tax=Brevibacillus fulvus TaxID=1125967 RepID=A0A938Y6J4_9BACL|nr:large subunit ribosomal protein L25 [Brevibacillus fulvus]
METIQAEKRSVGQRSSNKALRHSGWVPAVVYGSDVSHLAIQISKPVLEQALRSQAMSKPFKLAVDGSEWNVMVYEIQREPVGREIIHVDFKQINMNERIHTSVPIVLTGTPQDGVAALVRHNLEITCLPANVPESFTIDVGELSVGDVVVVRDLDIPAGVEVELDDLEVLVSVLAPKVSSDEAVEAEREAEAVAEEAGSS